MSDPWNGGGEWLRCALHAHTTGSDGELEPSALVEHYERAGYDVLAITDHWVRTAAASTDRLLVIPSAELNARAGGPEHDAHVLALGIATDPEPPETEFAGLPETVAWIEQAGGVPYLAHTYWSGLRTDQFEECPGLVGIEVYNAGCELEVGRGEAALHWDEALERGARLLAIATDDSHHPGFDSGFAWVSARCAGRTQESVLGALRAGTFYSSTGPAIHDVAVDDDGVVVRCSPASSVTLYSGRTKGARVNAGRLGYRHNGRVLEQAADGALTAVRLERPRRSGYGRVEVAGALGGKAWTNPLWA